ncbi:hypothetical protein QBC39DRAFT_374332 [Podospora conica]|nr:hypothetical protein QBC39DRAFT_374332 [Schizothecium conicum]
MVREAGQGIVTKAGWLTTVAWVGVAKGVFEQPKGPSGGTKLAKKTPATAVEGCRSESPL